jgi:hypothetical protein
MCMLFYLLHTLRPLVAVLEHQGVELDWFLRLQKKAEGEAINALLSISEKGSEFFGTRHLGRCYGFPYIMRCLARYGISRPDLEDAPHPWVDFFVTSLKVGIVHANRQLKYRAKIKIPGQHLPLSLQHLVIQLPKNSRWLDARWGRRCTQGIRGRRGV